MATARTALQRQWSSGLQDIPVPPAQPTKFEIVVRQLRLENDPQCWVVSPTLRSWAAKHKNTHYIPEDLLASWDMHVLAEDL